MFARAFNGIELDLDETYAWGWDELYRIEDAHAHRRANASCPARPSPTSSNTSMPTTVARSRASTTFRRWNQDLIDQTISDLDGTHFDLAEPLQDV